MAEAQDDPPIQEPLAAQLIAAFAASELVVGLYDQQDVLRWANPAYQRRFLRGRALPISFADVIRHGHTQRFGVKIDSGDVEAFLEQVLSRRRGATARAFEADMIDGEWLWMTETLLPTGWLLSVASVITTLKHSERTLRQARDHALLVAQTDALTGAPNRRSVMERAEHLLADAQAAARPFCLVAVDLDHFKQVNDRYGHDGGDEVLRQFVRHCMAQLRQSDHFGRLGGEEFLLVLPGTNASDAMRASERLRERLPGAKLRDHDAPLIYTFSAGVAEAREQESVGDLLRRADRALYAAKKAGRDRTIIDDS